MFILTLGYPQEVKKQCLHIYLEANGFRRIERLTGVSHNTLINWVKEARNSLSTEPDYDEIPEIAQIDELLQGATSAPELLQAKLFARSSRLKNFCLLTK